jgi:hypothetical protein
VDIISSFMDRLTTPDREEGEEKKERMRMQPEGFRANSKIQQSAQNLGIRRVMPGYWLEWGQVYGRPVFAGLFLSFFPFLSQPAADPSFL